ncbi:septum formation initiator family protein [Caminibacter pacificus]|uniref:Phosphopyruvate hydratase n=1 Tax=Caminibacter pacificus TaxID=1424653 RepID=A0AAJ4UXW5_9BACT|nr:septum formation initiator family protein [Caminibacter pacificus]NPA87453.1 phosphopyruvate hydratase [Campylobacterota bacterium]QCI27727.1 phosphopyruvate hydratase [Caminibacter pacificus]ROR40098.1 septum formation initiator [Caminibacter pacificus]
MIDFDNVFHKKRFDFKILIVIAASILVGIYIINLMFGERSFSQMIELQNTKKILQQRVNNLKKENEKLQKEYFELKELEG